MLPEMIGTIILDLDGTVLESRKRLHQCYADILVRHGYGPMPPDEYWQMKRNRMDRRQQLAKSNATCLYDTFLKEWLDIIERERYLQLDTVLDGVYERLAELHADGKTLVLATMRQNKAGLLSQLDWLGIRRFFAEIFACPHSEGGKGKARRVMSLPLDASKCLWVGDTEADIEAARSMGCKVWAVSSGIRTASYLASLHPDFISHSLADNVDIPGLRPVAK